MKRVAFLLLALGLGLAAAARAGQTPNILFIMSDDHAAHALSCYGSRVNETPNLDRIARDGLRFSNAFVTNSICTPSRATILTGKYSHLNGTPVFNRFDGSQPTVAKMLQAAGYHTGMIGKWHLGSEPTGFDRWIILPGQGVYVDPSFLTPDGRVEKKGYVTDIITDLGIEFLEQRPKDKPFFLMLHHKAPHREWTPDAKNRERFKGAVIPEPATLRDDYASRPAALPENRQTVANDLTRRDLGLEPPADLAIGAARQKWLDEKPISVDVVLADGTKEALRPWDVLRAGYHCAPSRRRAGYMTRHRSLCRPNLRCARTTSIPRMRPHTRSSNRRATSSCPWQPSGLGSWAAPTRERVASPTSSP